MTVISITEFIPTEQEILQMLRSIIRENIGRSDIPTNPYGISSYGLPQPIFVSGLISTNYKNRPIVKAASML